MNEAERELLAGAEIGGNKGSGISHLAPQEPEALTVPRGAVMWLLMKALQTPEGDAWMRGFVTAHGEPSWILANQWGIQAGDAVIVRVPTGPTATGRPPNGAGR